MILFALLGLVAVGSLFTLFDGGDDASVTGPGTDTGDTTVKGTDGDDLLQAAAGDDLLIGFKGQDILFGNGGDDTIKGYSGDDDLLGGAGDDLLEGGVGNDVLFGGGGQDTLLGGSGDDILLGPQILSAELTPDTLIAYAQGLPGAVTYVGDPAERGEVLDGGAGDDSILIGAADTATSGDGSDEFQLGEWVRTEDEAVTITDFNSEEDVLVVRYTGATPPDLALRDADDDNLITELLLNGTRVATLTSPLGGGGLEVNEIILQRIR